MIFINTVVADRDPRPVVGAQERERVLDPIHRVPADGVDDAEEIGTPGEV